MVSSAFGSFPPLLEEMKESAREGWIEQAKGMDTH